MVTSGANAAPAMVSVGCWTQNSLEAEPKVTEIPNSRPVAPLIVSVTLTYNRLPVTVKVTPFVKVWMPLSPETKG